MSYIEPELNLDGMAPSSGGGREFHSHKIKRGDNIYRILPPFGTNHNGLPFAEVYLHWFQDLAGKPRPLTCSYSTERYCPVCEAAREIQKQVDDLLSDYKVEGKVLWDKIPAEAREKQRILDEQLGSLRAQRGFYYNAMDMSGTIGILRLPKTAAEKLGNKIKESINVLGINPLSLKNGVFFNIIQKAKAGARTKRDVEYEVEFVRESKNTPEGIVQMIKKSAVPDNIIQDFEKLAYDVHVMYPTRTAQELKRVMLGDRDVWGEIDAKRRKVNRVAAAEEGDEAEESPVVAATPPPPLAPIVKAAPAALKTATVVSQDSPDIARLKKELGLP